MHRLFTIPPAPFQGMINYRDEKGNDCQITAAEYFAKTKAAYCEYPFMTEGYKEIAPQAKQPQQLPTNVTSQDAANERRLRRLSLVAIVGDNNFEGSPDVTLQGIPNDNKLRLAHVTGEHAFVGFGILASCDIKKGERIAIYSGVFEGIGEHRGGPYTYLWGHNNAQRYRSLAGSLNHSFPNVGSYSYVENSMKITEFYAYEDIHKDDQVCIDYHRIYEKLGRHAELRYAELKEFVQSHDSTTIDFSNRSESRIQNCTLDKWQYILSNPSNLLLLYLDGVLTGVQVNHLLANTKHTQFYFIHHIHNYTNRDALRYDRMLQDGISGLDAKFAVLRNENPALLATIREFFYEKIRDASAIGALFAFAQLGSLMTTVSESCWQSLMPTLNEYAAVGIELFGATEVTSEAFKKLVDEYLESSSHQIKYVYSR